MKTIPLTQNMVTIVDDEDFNELNKRKWSAAKGCNVYYAVRTSHPTPKTILMHRVIMNAKKGDEIDHKNNDGLDNRKENLRFCTKSENQHNQISRIGQSSKFKGVGWSKSNRRWISQIRINGKRIHLGSFEDEEEAARAYDIAARKYFGEFACLNFQQLKK